jgi:hypothetical protein
MIITKDYRSDLVSILSLCSFLHTNGVAILPAWTSDATICVDFGIPTKTLVKLMTMLANALCIILGEEIRNIRPGMSGSGSFASMMGIKARKEIPYVREIILPRQFPTLKLMLIMDWTSKNSNLV